MSSIHDPRYQRLIAKLVEIRETKNVTQLKLATSLHKPQSYIAKVENFERRLDILELCDWVSALDEDIVVFLKNTLY